MLLQNWRKPGCQLKNGSNSAHVKFRTSHSTSQQQQNYLCQSNASPDLSGILLVVQSRRSLTSPTRTGTSLRNTIKPGDSAKRESGPSKPSRIRALGLLLPQTLTGIWQHFPALLGEQENRNGTRLQVQIHYKIVCKNSWAL